MTFIIDPQSGKKYSLFSKNGKRLLKSYIKAYQSGGSGTPPPDSYNTSSGTPPPDSYNTSSGTPDFPKTPGGTPDFPKTPGGTPDFPKTPDILSEEPQTPNAGVNIPDPSTNKLKKLQVVDCISELLKFDENENKTGRHNVKKNKTDHIYRGRYTQCSNKSLNILRKKEDLQDKLRKKCYWDDPLVYHEHPNSICLNADTPASARPGLKAKLKRTIWFDIFNSINNMGNPPCVVIVSHHNLIKEVLLPLKNKKHPVTVLGDDGENDEVLMKHGIANCACIKITFKKEEDTSNLSVTPNLEVIFGGFPDKAGKYDYLKKGEKTNVPPTTTTTTFLTDTHPKILEPLINGIEKYNTPPIQAAAPLTDKKIPLDTLTIYLVRHGNSMHNQPMMKELRKRNGFTYRPLDSNLTREGYKQAQELGESLKKELEDKQVAYVSSNLKRAQETALVVWKQVDPLNFPLNKFKNKLQEESEKRIFRRLTGNCRTLGKKLELIPELLKTDNINLPPEKVSGVLVDKVLELVNSSDPINVPLTHNIKLARSTASESNSKSPYYGDCVTKETATQLDKDMVRNVGQDKTTPVYEQVRDQLCRLSQYNKLRTEQERDIHPRDNIYYTQTDVSTYLRLYKTYEDHDKALRIFIYMNEIYNKNVKKSKYYEGMMELWKLATPKAVRDNPLIASPAFRSVKRTTIMFGADITGIKRDKDELGNEGPDIERKFYKDWIAIIYLFIVDFDRFINFAKYSYNLAEYIMQNYYKDEQGEYHYGDEHEPLDQNLYLYTYQSSSLVAAYLKYHENNNDVTHSNVCLLNKLELENRTIEGKNKIQEYIVEKLENRTIEDNLLENSPDRSYIKDAYGNSNSEDTRPAPVPAATTAARPARPAATTAARPAATTAARPAPNKKSERNLNLLNREPGVMGETVVLSTNV